MANSDQKTLRWLWSVSGKQKWNILYLTVLEILIGGSGVAFAYLLRGVINAAVAKEGERFWRHVFTLILLTVCQLLIRAGIRFLSEYLKSSLENAYKSRLFSVLLRRDYSYVVSIHSGEWLNRLTSDVVVVAEGIATIVPEISGMLVQLVGATVMIFYLIPGIGMFVLPLGLFFAVLTFGFRKVLKSLHGKIQEQDGRLRVFLTERLSNLLVVKSFAMEEETSLEANEKMTLHQRARMKRNHFSNACNVGFGVLMRGSYVAGAVICGWGIYQGTMSYGNLMAVMQLIGQIQSPFANISGYLPKYYALLASAERLIAAESFPSEPEGKKKKEEIQEVYETAFLGIELEKVCFTYVEPDQGQESRNPIVLKEINLMMKKGEYLAITGDSGCGKSTLLKLMMSLYHPDSGQILIDLKDGKVPCDAVWRGLFAYVPQGNQLISGTIREILTFGKVKSKEEDAELWKALAIADAERFVRELPLGLGTELGERGAGLSEGQIQRLAIARAIVSRHPILLLDEATSSLDENSEKRVLSNLREMTDRTVIIVTHRPGALAVCDKQISFRENEVIIKQMKN